MNRKPFKPVGLAVCCSFAIALAASLPAASASGSHQRTGQGSLTGAWSGTYSGAYHGTFTLQWTQSGSKLSGKNKLSSNRGVKVPLNGTVRGSTIRFGTVGTAAVTYSGQVSGRSMSGAYQTAGGNGSWSAHRTS